MRNNMKLFLSTFLVIGFSATYCVHAMELERVGSLIPDTDPYLNIVSRTAAPFVTTDSSVYHRPFFLCCTPQSEPPRRNRLEIVRSNLAQFNRYFPHIDIPPSLKIMGQLWLDKFKTERRSQVEQFKQRMVILCKERGIETTWNLLWQGARTAITIGTCYQLAMSTITRVRNNDWSPTKFLLETMGSIGFTNLLPLGGLSFASIALLLHRHENNINIAQAEYYRARFLAHYFYNKFQSWRMAQHISQANNEMKNIDEQTRNQDLSPEYFETLRQKYRLNPPTY